jgi:putative hydrolase of the HAD superfamily
MTRPLFSFLFDIGNVLLHVDFETSLRRLFPNPPPDLPLRFARLLKHKDELETGRTSPEAFLDKAVEILGFSGSREEFLTAWLDVFAPNEPMWRTVEELSGAGHRLILFSNTNALHMDDALKRYEPVFSHFPEAVFSHEVGSMKPDEPIYRHAIEALGLVPEQTIYIDDLAENIESGRRFGFRVWRYDPARHEEFLDWLREQLG